jgi:solute carrier family 25 (peroxisomal adenine nucleotide transporter), member 17
MAAGALAGSATVFLTNPIWVVNTRMTARKEDGDNSPTLPTSEESEKEKAEKPSSIGTLLKIIKEDGFMRLFAGVMPALVLVLNPILQYTVYERLKQILEKTRKVGARESFVLGAIGKLVATGITYPYITVKSRAHVATGDSAKEGMTASLRRIIREEGVSGLYGGMFESESTFRCIANISEGVVPRVSQSVITAAFLFAFKDVLYEATKKARKQVVQK